MVCLVHCPVGFTHVWSVNGCYQLVQQNEVWDQVGVICDQLASTSHAVIINNQAEQLAIAEFINGEMSFSK